MLVSVIGGLGSGKTLLTTILATKSDRKVYANYRIKQKNFSILQPEILLIINEPSLIIIDEAYAWLESRTSGGQLNRYMSYILFQSRKRNIDFLLTSQIYNTVDRRFRLLTDIEIQCKHSDIGFEYYIFTQKSEKPINKFILSEENAERYYELYDTFEKIDPIDERMIFNISTDKGKDIEEINNVAEMIVNKYEGKRISKAIVEDFCLQQGYPKYKVNLIYNRIKHLEIKEEI